MKPTKKSLIPYYEKVDLSDNEEYRIYEFPSGAKICIDKPQFLIISDNGHRVYDAEKISHYIPYGWIHLYWKNIADKSFLCEEDKSNE